MSSHLTGHTFRRARLAGAPRPRLLACLVGAALAQFAASSAQADSGNGTDTWLGNALNPAGVSTTGARDPDGLGQNANSRSPTGFLHVQPQGLRAPSEAQGWWTRGSVELGALSAHGDTGARNWREYKSLQGGLLLGTVQVEAGDTASAGYLEVIGGSLGRNDQYFGITAGRYNSWRVKAFYNEIDHVYTTTYRNLWSGTGTGRLTLNDLTPGPVAPVTAASNDIVIGNAVAATPYSALSVLRQRGGIRLDLRLAEKLRAFASFTSEARKGARPFGMVSAGGGGTGGIEIPESIDYDTHDVIVGLQWAEARTQVNLQASASLFRNNVSTLTVDNPMFLAAANGLTSFPQAVFDLYPDNDHFNLKAEVAHSIPEWWRARVTGVVSLASSRQNDALIPYTPQAGAVVNGVAGGQWNTTASLSRDHAEARVDTRLVDLGLALTPLDTLQLRAKWRHWETDNKTPEYIACNPLTGQIGRLINDGSNAVFVTANVAAGNNPTGTLATAYDAARCNLDAIKALNLVPSAGNVNISNILYEQTQDVFSLNGDWSLARGQNLTLALERENTDREHRERASTDENRVKIGYVNRSLEGGTLRLSAEQARRRGSTYVPDPYEEFYSASLGPLPTAAGTNMTSWIHTNDWQRKFDLSDRNQTVFNARFNQAVRDDLDIALTAQLKDQRYPGVEFGRKGAQRQHSIGLDMNWQPTPTTQVWGYVSRQDSKLEQAGIHQNACALGSTYYLYSDGSTATTATPTAAQTQAGITVVGNSGVVTAANFAAVCGTPSAISPLYPLSRAWTATQNDHSISAGLGLRHDFGRIRGDVTVSSTNGRTSLSYTYNAAAIGMVTSGAPTAAQLAALALVGDGMPRMLVRTDAIDANLVWPLSESFALRLLLRHEQGKIKDWHYDGVADNPTPSNNQQTYLDAGPTPWRVNLVGVMMQIAW